MWKKALKIYQVSLEDGKEEYKRCCRTIRVNDILYGSVYFFFEYYGIHPSQCHSTKHNNKPDIFFITNRIVNYSMVIEV